MEKKKSANYIIPATFFTSLSPAAKAITKPLQTKQVAEKVAKPIVQPTLQKPVLKNVKRRASSLSLKSIHVKKEEKSESQLEENFDNHPKDVFTQSELEKSWKEYHAKLIAKGQKSIAATLISNMPKFGADFVITFELPNNLMSDQVEKEKPRLMKHLREVLNNYGITIQVLVSETVTKKFVYTPQEKYEKLLELNPTLGKL